MRTLDTIHHVAVLVSNTEQAIKEARLIGLQFEIVECHEDWAFLQFANLFVALVTESGKEHLGVLVDAIGLSGLATKVHRDGSVGAYLKTEAGLTVERLNRETVPESIRSRYVLELCGTPSETRAQLRFDGSFLLEEQFQLDYPHRRVKLAALKNLVLAAGGGIIDNTNK